MGTIWRCGNRKTHIAPSVLVDKIGRANADATEFYEPPSNKVMLLVEGLAVLILMTVNGTLCPV